MGLIPGLGGFPVSWGNQTHGPEPLSPHSKACALQQEKPLQWGAGERQLESSPLLPQLEKACVQQWRPNATKNKFKKFILKDSCICYLNHQRGWQRGTFPISLPHPGYLSNLLPAFLVADHFLFTRISSHLDFPDSTPFSSSSSFSNFGSGTSAFFKVRAPISPLPGSLPVPLNPPLPGPETWMTFRVHFCRLPYPTAWSAFCTLEL